MLDWYSTFVLFIVICAYTSFIFSPHHMKIEFLFCSGLIFLPFQIFPHLLGLESEEIQSCTSVFSQRASFDANFKMMLQQILFQDMVIPFQE